MCLIIFHFSSRLIAPTTHSIIRYRINYETLLSWNFINQNSCSTSPSTLSHAIR